MWHTLAQIGPGPRVNNKRLFPPGLLCDKGITVRSVLTPFFCHCQKCSSRQTSPAAVSREKKRKVTEKERKEKQLLNRI